MTTELLVLALLVAALAYWVVSLMAPSKAWAVIAGILAAMFVLYGAPVLPFGLTTGVLVAAILLATLAYFLVKGLTPKESGVSRTGKTEYWAKIAALVMAGLVLFGGVAWAATNFTFTNRVTLEDGTYCVTNTHELEGNELTLQATVSDGACGEEGTTITIGSENSPTPTPEATPTPEPTTTPTPTPTPSAETTIPAHCPQDVDYNVVEVSTNAGEIYGTSKPDLIIAGSGVKVWARGNADCVLTGSGSKVHGQTGPDYIKTGTGSEVNGGAGKDKCITGFGSSETSCELD